MLIDTHCHLDWDSFQADLPDVIARAHEAGVQRLLTIGTDVQTSRRAVEIAHQYDAVYAAVGIHPHDAKTADDAALAAIEELAHEKKVVALGEVGLDFFKNYSPHDVQRLAFQKQIRLARRLGLPLIVHDRDAHEETLRILREEGDRHRGVFHCFAGDEKIADEALALGFDLSFTGNVTFKKNDATRAVVRHVPLERIMVETDAPFLAPMPYRGKRNEPAYTVHVAEKIAAVHGVSLEEVARVTSTNAFRLFRFEHFGRRGEIAYGHRSGAKYVNLTSRCSNCCVFCIKQPDFTLGEHYLYLDPDDEPTVQEVLAAVGDPSAYPEIVFCGEGEPTVRWDDMIAIAKELKKRGARRVRLNTNGQAELIHGRALAREMKGAIDAVSVSLNAPDAAEYQRLCRSEFGEQAFAAVTDFIGQAKRYVPEVIATAVTQSGVDIEATRRFAETMLGVAFRAR
ncbi:MAG: YchF/TatD family DNA exonuclease [Candidatus Lernaella stagnicola]|nr:YchF/TatD family DNA exonuclease [Candidatus Lernaella stagnicola]